MNGTQIQFYGFNSNSTSFPINSISAKHFGCTNYEIILTKPPNTNPWLIPTGLEIIEGNTSSPSIIVSSNQLGDFGISFGNENYKNFLSITTLKPLPTFIQTSRVFCFSNDRKDEITISTSTNYSQYEWKIFKNFNLIFQSTNMTLIWEPDSVGSYTVQFRGNDCCGWTIPIFSQVSKKFVFDR